jgi:(Z)-2-((N-methylformamido)methylene)-5-hydroxybutyrolactone dehydrogenase
VSNAPSAGQLPHHLLHICGQWREGRAGRRFDAINPFTARPWATVAQAEIEDVDAAIAAARDTFERTWSRVSGYERSRLMNKLADLLQADAERMGRLESTDNGKIIRETQTQMVLAARQYRFFAGYADKLWGQQIPLDQRDVFDYATREPLGVVALITAWNSPMGLLANKLAPALAAGNCVVIKPSEHASVTTLEFCRFVEAAGFPPGVVNVVCGAGEVGRALIEGGVAKVSFTGSAAVGREIAATAGRRLVPVTLELGGKSPNIIFEDAHLEHAAIGALAGIFGATGQTCVAGSRLLVQRSVHDRIVQTLIACAHTVRLGDPLDPATEMGTAANEPQFRRILAFIERARAQGARLVAGGGAARSPGLEHGFFIEPTVFADVRNEMEIAQEEVFGPVLAVIPFEDEEDALRIANATRYGLAAGVWTENLSRALRVTRALRAGQVWVNTYRSLAVQTPFGGFKESGFGREKGEQALDEYLASKNVMIDFSNLARDPFAMRT